MIRKLCRLAIAATALSALTMAVPRPAGADGISPGAAVGLGLGAFALGAIATSPYRYGYGPSYAPYGYYPAPAYYPPAPAYYAPPRSCWNPYYGGYYAC